MATIQKNNAAQANTDFLRIKDLLYICLAKWHWFVISLTVCLGVATVYLLRTPAVYTRTASILIKDDANGNSAGANMTNFGDLGLITTNTNVINEMAVLQSPDLMREVVERLGLYMTYTVEGRFHKEIVYGDQLPIKVSLSGLRDNESASMLLHLDADGTYTLSDLTRNGASVGGTVKGKLNETVASPYGRLSVVTTARYKKGAEGDIEVARTPIAAAAAGAAGGLGVTQAEEKSNIITLSYQDVNTQRADDILNALVQVYNENWLKDKNQIAVSTSLFINDRLGVIEGELGHVDNDISSYKSSNLLPDVQAVASMYMSQANEANSAVKELDNQIYMARYMRGYLTGDANRNQLLPASSGIDNSQLSSQITAYNSQLLERNNIVAKSSEKNPLVVEMDAALDAMRKALVRTIDNQIVALEAQVRMKQKSGGQATSQIASNPKQAKYLLSVERQQKVKEALYLYLLQKREENELSQAFTAYNTRVITRPSGSSRPTAPANQKILLTAFVMGLLIPIVIIYIMETANNVVRGRKDLNVLSTPIIGEIPLCLTRPKRKWWMRKEAKSEENAIVVKEGNRNIVNEAFRVLRSNIDFMMASQPGQNVFVFTSFNPGSGKSFLAMNMSVCFALKGKRVLAIDGDLRHGSTSAYVGSPQTGLTNYLSGMTDDWQTLVVRDKKYDNLHVLPIGKIPPNPIELLENGRIASLIAQARDMYDYILIDCPPIDVVADTQVLEKYADRTFFVVRAGLLDRSMLPDLEAIYQEKRFKNLSVILNATKSGGGRYSYRYGYRHGYRYGYASYYGSKSQRGE